MTTEDWIGSALAAAEADQPSVLVTVVGHQGSSPREVGARMLITATERAGSVGGGVLEHMAIQRSRRWIGEQRRGQALIPFPLGPDSQQCCGGLVVLWFQTISGSDAPFLRRWLELQDRDHWIISRIDPDPDRHIAALGDDLAVPDSLSAWARAERRPDLALLQAEDETYIAERAIQDCPEIALFGAGHVGRALVRALAEHRCHITWVDSRADEFPAEIPANVTVRADEQPEQVVRELPALCHVLVMTHRHPLDYALCREVLERDDAAYLGLIGSVTKRRRFTRALVKDGLPEEQVEQLICPIGLAGIEGKQPAVIAASVVAQLLILWSAGEQPQKRHGISEEQAESSSIGESF